MYLVIFNKGTGRNYFGPFETLEAAELFVEEDTVDRRPFMKVALLIPPTKVRTGEKSTCIKV